MYAHQFILLFIFASHINCEEDLKIKIGLPEYICGKDGGIRDVKKDITTIRLLGNDADSVNYKFDVNFIRIGNKCRNNQRCTLILWQKIRELNNYLTKYPVVDHMQHGFIEINNTMFMPGIKYALDVTIMNNTDVIEVKHLTLDYIDEDVKKSIRKPIASLLLLGSHTSYAYATYIINAEVTICSNITFYQFQWELVDENGNSTVMDYKGSTLTIEPDTFQGSRTYTINCDLISVTDGAPIANASQTVNVLSKGLLLSLPIKNFTTQVNQAVRIRAFMKDLDNIDGDMKIFWSCLEVTGNKQCEYQSDTSGFEMDSVFTHPGRYKITLEISKSEFTESDSCFVDVMENVPITEFEEIEIPVNPSSGIEIRATVYELRTSCTLQWVSVDGDGYEFLDLKNVPGNAGDITNITLNEDLFLYELEEFSNTTVDKRHDLIIPPPSDEWEGLKGDSTYLFRLLIKCPKIVENLDDFNETESLDDFITISNDVLITTNGPPKIESLQVTPDQGDAFITLFSFKSQNALDKDSDGPVLYKFGYILENKDVILWTLADVTNCEAILPYSKDGIQTFLECCDNFNSCDRIFGPLIIMNLPQETSIEFIAKPFVQNMKTEDYSKAFNSAFSILHSFNSDETKLVEIRDLISQKIDEKIDLFLNMENDEQQIRSANQLILNVNQFKTQLQLSELTLTKLIELRNKLSDENPEKYIQRKLLSYQRTERSNSLSLQDVKGYIEVSEWIITTSNDPNKINLEKENLRKQLNNYMEKLCTSLYKKSQPLQLELKTLIMSVEKLNKNSLNNFISIPFERNKWQTLARVKLQNILENNKQKCIGKVIFRDYLGKNGIIYFVQILNGNEIDESNEVIILLPRNKSQEGKPNCIVYRDGWHSDCKTIQTISNYVKCSCKYLGYYFLEYDQTATQTSVLPSIIKIMTTSISLTETIGNVSNESMARTYREETSKGNYDTVSYVIIIASIIGIAVLAIILRKIFQEDEDKEDSEAFEFPKYAQLHNEELLHDAHM